MTLYVYGFSLAGHLFFARSSEVPTTCSFSVGDAVRCSIGKERKNKRLIASNLSQVSDHDRETGVITRLHDSYGFIRCSQRDCDIFFHFKELPYSATELRMGDGVEFQVQNNPRSDRLQATGVYGKNNDIFALYSVKVIFPCLLAALKLIDSSEVSFFTIDEQIHYGYVERRFDSRNVYHSSEGALGKISYRVLRTKEEMELAASDEHDGNGNDEPVVIDVEEQEKLKDSEGNLPNQDDFPEKNGCTVASEVLLHRKTQHFEDSSRYYQANFALILFFLLWCACVCFVGVAAADRTPQRLPISRKKIPEV